MLKLKASLKKSGGANDSLLFSNETFGFQARREGIGNEGDFGDLGIERLGFCSNLESRDSGVHR